jgi:hypothetical protein
MFGLLFDASQTIPMDDIKVYCFGGFVKHAALINKVYPTKPGEEGPRSSDLSYLVFYAQHRPEKLAKVGRYLCKRFSWDAAKQRFAYDLFSLRMNMKLVPAVATRNQFRGEQG